LKGIYILYWLGSVLCRSILSYSCIFVATIL